MSSPRELRTDVAVFLPSLDGGGAETVMLRVAGELAERGRTTDLVVARAGGTLRDRVPAAVRLVDLRARPPVVATKTVGLARYLSRSRPRTLISALDIVNSAIVARRAARSPTRVVLTTHTHLTRQFEDKPDAGVATLRRAIVRALYPRTDALVAVSQGVAEDIAALAGIDPRRITVIPNPVVDDELERRAREPVDHPFLTSGSSPVVVGVGRLVRQKDFATLLRAFARVREARDARLLILGAGDPREPQTEAELRHLVAQLGLGQHVSLPGWVDNPAAYIARADVFALSSAYEGFGNVVVEALAVGTPVVSTDCQSGPAEILEGGRFGRLVRVGDTAGLARAILDTLDAQVDGAALRRRAARYRTDRIVDEYLAVIDGAPHTPTAE